jgi:hypothetical protein
MSDLTKKFLKNPLEFMKKNAICPKDDIGGYTGSEITTLNTTGFVTTGTTEANPVTSVSYRGVSRDKKIGYVQLYKDMDRAGIQEQRDEFNNITQRYEDNREGKEVVRFNVSYNAVNGWAPVYWLPWYSYGGIVRLVIPPKGRNNPDPDIFFTAAINGCSIFFQGTAQNPTVYHAGGKTGQSDHNQAARFWREALRNYIASSNSAKNRGFVPGEVNKMHYVKSPGTAGNATTPRAQEYENHLKQKMNKQGKFTITMVNPWGCVMGIRTGNDWAFYLQENATVMCNIVTKKDGVQSRIYARPMAITKVFPGGGAVASMQMKVPVKVD